MGTESGTNTIDATSVEVPAARDTGIVASTTPTFTITTTNPAATVTVNLSATTTYTEPGFSPPSLTDIMVGDRVLVSGNQDGTNTVNATSVYLPPAMEAGTVASTTPTFTITIGDPATVTVNLSSTTTYRSPAQLPQPHQYLGRRPRAGLRDPGRDQHRQRHLRRPPPGH